MEQTIVMTIAGECDDCGCPIRRWAQARGRRRRPARCARCTALQFGPIVDPPSPAQAARSRRITSVEAARLAHVSSEAIRLRCRRGSFATARRDEAGHWTVERGEVEDWMDSQRA